MSVVFLSLHFFYLWMGTSLAAEIVETNPSVKALGMGNAYSAFARREEAIFYNPAGLARGSGIRLSLVGIDLGLNGLDSYEEYADILDNASNDLASTLSDLYGRPIYARANAVSAISIGSFSFGAYINANISTQLFNPAFPVLKSNAFSDFGYFFGMAWSLYRGQIDMGVVGKSVSRVGGAIDLGPSTFVNLDSDTIEEQLKSEGTGYAADFGINWRVPAVSSWNPTLSFVWKDIGDTSLGREVVFQQPESIQSQMNVGMAFQKDIGMGLLSAAVDFRNVHENGQTDLAKKTHAGLEISLPIIALRGGFNQGYYTAGASIDLWLFEISAATYGVELGEYAGQDEDRRYSIQLSMNLGYNPKKGFYRLNTKKISRRKSGRKQRR